LWAIASVFWSVSPLDTIGESWNWVVLFALFVVAFQCRHPVAILWALCLGLIVNLPFVIFQLKGFVPVIVTDIPAGLFLSRNALGEVAACALVWTVARGTWALVLPPLLLVLLSGSRGALLACGVGFLFLVRSWWQRLAVVALVLAAAGAWTYLRDPALASILLRFEIWQVAASNLTIFGWGLETFAMLVPQYEFVHNDPLQLIFELGMGAVFAIPIFVCVAQHRSPESIAFLALAAASCVSFPLHHPLGAALMAVLSGLVLGDRNRAEYATHLSREVAARHARYERDGPSTGLRQVK
jgi:hypothetical protein